MKILTTGCVTVRLLLFNASPMDHKDNTNGEVLAMSHKNLLPVNVQY